ncbi:glycosyltransferase [Rheinheimera sp. UJ51]|uniref:glycosyltransferase n=1 Tax=Rheinheimera sp. UJ51 TaxID=2892446 RepID=UPI002D1F9F04|nr:glycosyltransferase [Rheinheimera sp. UJ51]
MTDDNCAALLVALNASERFFVYYQLKSINFQGINNTSSLKLIKLYKSIVDAFNQELKEKINYIPAAERNENLIVVFISQFLGLNHAPTKTALDRIKVIKNSTGKDVILINTCELLPMTGAVPWFDTLIGNRTEIKNGLLEYQGIKFKYAQCSSQMPNLEEMGMLIDVINTLKPGFTLSIGDNLLADICSQIVPNAVISTVFSSLSFSPSQFRVIGRNVTEIEKSNLTKQGLSTDSVIESIFTFDFKPQNNIFNRKDLGLPEDKFLIALVGGRLTNELSEKFLQLLLPLCEHDIHFVIIGNLDTYTQFCNKYSNFKDNFSNLGFQDDVLAVLEICDLYLNPPRIGGGSSAAEALSKGKPVVTLDSGDVATAVGIDFTVKCEQEMYKIILKYKTDNHFYLLQSNNAIERAAILLDSDKAFTEVLQQINLHHFYDYPWELYKTTT